MTCADRESRRRIAGSAFVGRIPEMKADFQQAQLTDRRCAKPLPPRENLRGACPAPANSVRGVIAGVSREVLHRATGLAFP